MTTTDDTRARFHRLTAEAFAEPLPGGCVVRVVAEDEWKSIHDRLVAEAFDRSRNNAILVPKLQAGFLLSSFEVSLNHGLAVHLRYPFNDSIRTLYAYRIDAARNSAALRAAGILDDDLVAG